MVNKDPSCGDNPKVFKNTQKNSLNQKMICFRFFMRCPAGWGCQISSGNSITALKLEEAGFLKLITQVHRRFTGSFKSRALWARRVMVGYYWAPNLPYSVNTKCVKVDFGTGIDKVTIINCIAENTVWNPKKYHVSHPLQSIRLQQWRSQKSASGYGVTPLKRSFTCNAKMNSLSHGWRTNQADGQYAAENFMLNIRHLGLNG